MDTAPGHWTSTDSDRSDTAAPAPAESLAASTRALAPLSAVLVIALTVGLAAVVSGGILVATETSDPPGDPGPRASLSLAVADETLSLTHRGGDRLDVRRLRLVVAVDGEPLTHQPPVPFFSARGFHSGPSGPFNPATDPQWTAGETATLSVAGTNQPTLATGTLVTVRVYADDTLVADLSARS